MIVIPIKCEYTYLAQPVEYYNEYFELFLLVNLTDAVCYKSFLYLYTAFSFATISKKKKRTKIVCILLMFRLIVRRVIFPILTPIFDHLGIEFSKYIY